MSIKLIVLDEEPNNLITDRDIRRTNLACEESRIVEDDGLIGWVINAFDWTGATIGEDEEHNRTVQFGKVFRDRYFRQYYDEFKRWIERAAKMDFDDYKSFHGNMKFGDAERWFKRPNEIHIWYSGWYSTLTEFLRNVEDDEVFYFGNAFDII